MSSPLVSIIIPLYNQGDYIKEAIESVRSQTYPNWELIIMDDGSTDNGGQIVQDFARIDSRINLFRQNNSGPSVARNECISRSNGKYILPLDGDDKIGAKYLEKAVDYLENNADCKLVYCLAEKFGEENGIWNLPDYEYDKLLWNNMIFCTAMYRRSDYNMTNGYNPNMVFGYEDWDFWLSLISPQDNVHKINDVLFFYRIKSVSRNITMLRNNYKESVRQIFKNHPSLYKDYINDTILLHNELEYKNLEIKSILAENSNIINSHTFKIGRLVTAPYTFIKKLINHS